MLEGSSYLGRNRLAVDSLLLRDGGGAEPQTLTDLLARIEELERASAQMAEPVSGIDNLLEVSDFDHSVLSYTGAGSNTDLYRWCRGANAANAINAGTSPKWEKADGWLTLSSTSAANDLCYPFLTRVIRPGQVLHLLFNARLKAPARANGVSLEVGFWDETAGFQNWIADSLVGSAGSAAPIVTKIGPGAATTTYTYRVVAYTDAGGTVVSAAGTIVGAAALTVTDYNRIEWAEVAGATAYHVFRTVPAGSAGLVEIITTGATSYNDIGPTRAPGTAVPLSNPARALRTISDFGARLRTDWQPFRVAIRIPRAYNLSATGADKQFFRLGLRGALTPPEIEVDRIGLSLTPGAWAPAREDRAAGDTVITPVGDGGQWTVGVDGIQPYLDYGVPAYQ